MVGRTRCSVCGVQVRVAKTWYYVFMSALLFLCVVTLFSGLLMCAFSGTKAWKDNKKELYRLAKESIRDKWCEG